MANPKVTFAYSEVPPAYGLPFGGKREGFIWSKSGMGSYEFPLFGVVRWRGWLIGTTDKHIGVMPGSQSKIEPLDAVTLDDIRGTLGNPEGGAWTDDAKITIDSWDMFPEGPLDSLGDTPAYQTPVRHLLQTETMDFKVNCGKTIYGIEIGSNATEGVIIGVASRFAYGEPMKLRKWSPIPRLKNMATFVVYGVEFRILLYAKDVPPFSIDYLKIFFKLTDRRGQYYGYQDLTFESRRPVGYGQSSYS